MRLIDADKALKIAESYGTTHGTTLGRHSGVADIIHYEIAKLPTIKAEPVKHGKWSLLKKTATWKTIFPYQCEISCSVCGYGTIACDEQSKNDWLVDMNFCPNCGAKMDGGNEND